MNQRERAKKLKWWQTALAVLGFIPMAPLLIGCVLVALVLYVGYSLCLNIVIWCWWCLRGRDILFVYSDSPIWRDYIEEHLLPHLRGRALVLNGSERTRWRLSLSTLAFQHFGGHREFNPLAVVFRPLRRARTFRFWKPFQEFKRGNEHSLHQMQHDLLVLIGAHRNPTTQ